MGRVSIVLLLSLLVWASGTASTLGQGGRVDITQVDITRFPEVTVFFRVLDSSGKSLGQLCCDKVDVEEDGRRARILQILDKGSFPITTALVVDCSGSMADAVAGATKLDAAKKACHEFLKLSRPTDKNCLIQFNTVATVVCQFEAPLDHLHRSVDALQAGGNTAWRDAVVEALNMLAVRQGRRSVILLTDGQDNSSVRSIALVIENARKIQVPVYAIALGEYHQIDERELRQLAQETGGSYLLMPSPAQLAQLYEEMAKSLQEEVAVTYITNRPYPDGTRRRIRLSVQIGSTVFSGEGSYLEPHVLNPGSHFGVFLFWLVVLGLCYAGPFALDAHRKQAFRRACKEAFREESDENKVVSALLPRGELVTQVHPKAVLREAAPRVVSVRIDTILRPPEGTTILHQPLHLIVLLDLSASMEGERLIAAYSAIESLVGGMANRDSFCLVGFSDTASLVVPPIRIQSGRKLILSQLKDLSTGARTILAPALEMVPSLLPPARSSNQRRTCAVIVSDGMIEDRFPALETASNSAAEWKSMPWASAPTMTMNSSRIFAVTNTKWTTWIRPRKRQVPSKDS
ncbi:MAG: VWA domain-containing protein [Thermoguttaceae bacterium]|nr:VWA domain-containing protein [Thermoguttaceae bacterium]